MNNLTATLTASAFISASKTRDLADIPYSVASKFTSRFTFGTGALQVNQVFDDIITLGTSGTSSIDLASGNTNAFAESIAFAEVKAILIVNESPTAALKVYPHATNGATNIVEDVLHIPPMGRVVMFTEHATGWVVDSTHKVLVLENVSGAVTLAVTVIILGNT